MAGTVVVSAKDTEKQLSDRSRLSHLLRILHRCRLIHSLLSCKFSLKANTFKELFLVTSSPRALQLRVMVWTGGYSHFYREKELLQSEIETKRTFHTFTCYT